MKARIHPEYRAVIFEDAAAGFRFLSRSTARTERTTEWEDGGTYPLVSLDISSASHPYYTGTQKLMDTQGRIERFKRRYAR